MRRQSMAAGSKALLKEFFDKRPKPEPRDD
jgi:hypothetical protein